MCKYFVKTRTIAANKVFSLHSWVPLNKGRKKNKTKQMICDQSHDELRVRGRGVRRGAGNPGLKCQETLCRENVDGDTRVSSANSRKDCWEIVTTD